MHAAHLLQQLVVVLGAALLVVLLLARLRFPTIAGFLVAGALVGSFGVVQERAAIETMAEIGVVLLLFTIGLEFSLSHLRSIWKVVALGGGLQVGLTSAAVALLVVALGDTWQRGLFLGFLVALSSTAIVLRALAERAETDAPHGRLIVGALLFQDLCVVPMMMAVPMLAGRGGGIAALPWVLAQAVLVVILVVAMARVAVPRVLGYVEKTRRRDLFVLIVIFVCAGIAWLTSLAGLSLALGAFLAGVVLADSEYGHQALADVLPLRDTLASLFFVSIGMLLDLPTVVREAPAVGGIALAMLAGKALVATLAGLVMRFPLRVAVLAGVALAQVGEFSFVLAQLGASVGLIGPHEMRLFLTASVLTMLVTPFAVRLAPRLAAGAARLRGLERLLGLRDEEQPAGADKLSGHVLIVGYGTGGRFLAEALRSSNLPHAIVDIDAERVREIRRAGGFAWYGDGSSGEILERAGIHDARQVVVMVNDADALRRTVAVARRLAPEVPVLGRARFLGEIPPLLAAGATEVVAQEFEASVEIIARVLRNASVPRNVIGERLRDARATGTPSPRRLTLPRRRLSDHLELQALKIESLLLKPGMWAAGRTLAETALRRRTGATLVAIGRDAATAVHPAPDDHLQADDVLYIVAGGASLAAAQALLENGPDAVAAPPDEA